MASQLLKGVNSMARPKKNGHYLNVCILKEIYDALESYSSDTGIPKTVVVEKALQKYIKEMTENGKAE